jgi:hypothetical protein
VSASKDPLNRCLAALRKHRLLLAADAELPSVTTLVAGEPVSGSWWSHPAGKAIYDVMGRLADRDDVLVAKLVSAKVTYVHRPLWADVLAMALAREPWQVDFLPRREKELLELLDRAATVRIDDDLAAKLDADAGSLGKEIEARLLAIGGQVHTESGAHARTLTSWTTWGEELGVRPSPDVAAARERLDAAARALGRKATLPWWKKPLRRRW